MNQQHQEIYLNLISELLNCGSGEESKILAANIEWLDSDFLPMLNKVADYFVQTGEENKANRLKNIATQLSQETLAITPTNIDACRYFLVEVLNAIIHNRDVRVIYSLLTANTDKLGYVFALSLRRWATDQLAQEEFNSAADTAGLIGEFSNLIQQFPLGSKANNIEIAISGYEVILSFYTRSAFPQQWAILQINLGSAYSSRILGKRDDNLEKAIKVYSTALEVFTKSGFPEQWAMVQTGLGSAYSNRILGERAENLETAIKAYSAALEVLTRSVFPEQWAMVQNNLGAAYRDRILGERAENLETAIAASEAALGLYTKNAFPEQWAMAQNNLGAAYSNRILGKRADNIEIAITAYSAALEVFSRSTFPQQWAMVQTGLGGAYFYRILGEKAENLEDAIKASSTALEVLTRRDFPEQWATAQNNLGAAYRDRILGKRADNIEIAIAACSAALEVYTRNDFPQQWATAQNNLANAYRKRILEERADNIEIALKACSAALEVYTKSAFPEQYAMTQNNLGEAYRERILGEKSKNIEKAIIAYTAALEIYTKSAFPEQYAMTQNNLGAAYSCRILGEPSKNIEEAIIAYTAVLEIYTKSAFPEKWATAHNNLGNIYRNRILGEPSENIEKAITAYTAALKVYTKSAFPEQWAATQNNLGIAYGDGILGEPSESIEKAIAAYTAALEVRTRSNFPEEWAATQNNLGIVYDGRILGEPSKNIEEAIAAYTAALEVRTRSTFPQEHAQTLFNLGLLYQKDKQFDLAYNNFESAITTVESLREEILSGTETKRKQAEEWNKLYSCMVEVCLELGNIIAAIEYIERSKTRNLVEQILERDSKTIFPSDVVIQLEKYRDEIAKGQYQIQNSKAENPKVLIQRLQQLRQQRNELQNQHLPVGYGFKFNSFQTFLDEHTAIIEWYILEDKILAFIVKPTKELTVWQSQREDREALENWINQYLQDYYNQKHQWQNSLGEKLNELASILHIDEILTHIPNHCDQLILIPHRFLHLFPLHALPITSQEYQDSPYLIDIFAKGVSYAPSCQILQQVQKRKRPYFQSVLAIQNPTEDLNYADLEVEVIQSYFDNNTSNVLKKAAATLTSLNNSDLNNYHCTHFSCHGYFNLSNPAKSALILANAPVDDTLPKPNTERYLNLRLGETHDLDKCLTLDKIFILKLENCRLVTLSACETGLIDFQNTSDEYIGLPSGFLLAGSPSVVSSLWKVDDLPTSFLMIKFYENLFQLDNLEAGDISIAMKQAQTWLRNLTIEELDKFLEKKKPEIERVLAQLRKGQQSRFKESLKLIHQRKPLPFANPYYWASFTASGR